MSLAADGVPRCPLHTRIQSVTDVPGKTMQAAVSGFASGLHPTLCMEFGLQELCRC